MPLMQTWRTHHPSWTFKVWDAQSVGALVNASYPKFATTFHALPSKIQQADAARYVILHAEGGLYADLDVECFHPFDETLESKGTRGAVLFFEEPSSHWEAHNTIVSNGLMAAPCAHPLLSRLLHAIKPGPEVFASTGSHMLQETLKACDSGSGEDDGGEDGEGGRCGCYATKSSELYFPMHAAMRRPEEFDSPNEHARAMRLLIADVKSGAWPPPYCVSAQFWTVSWIDPQIGRMFLDALAAARDGRADEAEKQLYAVLWSKWGTKYKYRNEGGALVKKAKDAYSRAIDMDPTYAFGYYELANIELEQAAVSTTADLTEALRAEELLKTAVGLQPSSLLFHNNAGVARLTLKKPGAAADSFRKVLELEALSFSTVKGLSPKAGAMLNLGIALEQQERNEEALSSYRATIADGSSFRYALAAAQRIRGMGEDPGPPEELDITLGDTLVSEGRTREAAVRFAAAHMYASSESGEGREVRTRVAARMDALSEIWDLDPANRLKPPALRRGGGRGGGDGGGAAGEVPDLEVLGVGADGKTTSTNMGKVTPELLRQIKETGRVVTH